MGYETVIDIRGMRMALGTAKLELRLSKTNFVIDGGARNGYTQQVKLFDVL